MPSARQPATQASAEIRGGHTGHLRRANLERVQAFVMDHPAPFACAELIEATGLSAPTVGKLVKQLIQRGLVRDLGVGPSRGGRRPSLMEFNARYGFVAAISLGVAKTQLAVADLRGERLAQLVLATPGELEPAAALERLAVALRELARDSGIPWDRLLAVSVATPGLVDRDSGTVVALAPGLHWSNVPVAQWLGRALGVPVLVENDVNMAILGEHRWGAARGHDTCAYIEVGAGIGAGMLVEGRLNRGQHRMAGEIGFMCMAPDQTQRDFGDRGCLETLAGLAALAERWPSRARGDAELWVTQLYEAARAGDPEAVEAVREVATLVGIAVANLSLVIDPSLVVVGGVIAVPGSPFIEQLQSTVARIVPTPICIVPSELGEEAPLWGGLLTATAQARHLLRPRLRQAAAR
jgi:predicted NBD/HSP70 family sugar kinase